VAIFDGDLSGAVCIDPPYNPDYEAVLLDFVTENGVGIADDSELFAQLTCFVFTPLSNKP
jgi:hypothetical protein